MAEEEKHFSDKISNENGRVQLLPLAKINTGLEIKSYYLGTSLFGCKPMMNRIFGWASNMTVRLV